MTFHFEIGGFLGPPITNSFSDVYELGCLSTQKGERYDHDHDLVRVLIMKNMNRLCDSCFLTVAVVFSRHREVRNRGNLVG